MNMKLALLSVFLALPLLLPAQTAKVIQLDPEEAAKVKQLYQQKADAEQAISDFQIKIQEKYTKRKVEYNPGLSCLTPSGNGIVGVGLCGGEKDPATKKAFYWDFISGWNYGFEYSEDFKFIVPKAAPASSYIGNEVYACPNWVTPAFTLSTSGGSSGVITN
jgi:hypothetical protein